VVQAKLMGPPERESAWGTGLIPHDAIGATFKGAGVANALDTVSIKHVSGEFSLLQFKSYERGREKWQGAGLEVVWFDEEPPQDIYLEGLTRTNETGGIVYITFTPLLGHSDVVKRFIGDELAS
jgi:phage terminase large subunit-like protein